MVNIEEEPRKRLYIQGSERTSMPEELRRAVRDYYSGRGMPVKDFEKYYGLKTRLEIRR